MKQKIILIVALSCMLFSFGCSKKSDEETEKPITKENMVEELERLEQEIEQDQDVE